jgi:hypothetical protein
VNSLKKKFLLEIESGLFSLLPYIDKTIHAQDARHQEHDALARRARETLAPSLAILFERTNASFSLFLSLLSLSYSQSFVCSSCSIETFLCLSNRVSPHSFSLCHMISIQCRFFPFLSLSIVFLLSAWPQCARAAQSFRERQVPHSTRVRHALRENDEPHDERTASSCIYQFTATSTHSRMHARTRARWRDEKLKQVQSIVEKGVSL